MKKVHGSADTKILHRHIETFRKKNNNATVDQLVDHLRSSYPCYNRHKLRPFTKRVEQIINTSRRKKLDSVNDDETPVAMKRRKIDPQEERLQLIEARYVKTRRADVSNNSRGSSSSAASTASSGSSFDGDGLSDEEASNSEDAIFGEKFEPEFDLIKSALRDNYCQKSKESGKAREGKKVIEMDVLENKSGRKLNLVNDEGKQEALGRGDGLRSIETNEKSTGKDDQEKKLGPMFKDFGGMCDVIEKLKEEVIFPLYNPRLLCHLGVKPMSGILLRGPPGCGKTRLAHAIANEAGIPFYKISATELVSGVSGASEENIRDLFSKAHRTAPSIVFIDEIDAIASKRDNSQREMEKRIVTQLMSSMDESHKPVKPVDGDGDSESSEGSNGYVLVIGATNRPDAVDPALRRPGRFDSEIKLEIPDENARLEILSVVTSKLKLEGDFDLRKIARSTTGFVGADLAALAHKAGNLALIRTADRRKVELSGQSADSEHGDDWYRRQLPDEEIRNISITMADFEAAAKQVQPSLRREGFSSIPNVKWDDVGGLHLLREEFDRYIIRRIKYPEVYEAYGVDSKMGFLLYGPPGCGKTLIAKAVANEAGANFIHVKGPELLNKYVGESEASVRIIFDRARQCSPCILFFDEVDAITTKRGKEGGWVVERLLNQLLIELDGAEHNRGVYVIGATNRPEVMDPAVLRPGRLGMHLYVPLPSPDERGMILKALARKKPVDASVDLMALVQDNACENLSGADLSDLMNEACIAAMEEALSNSRSDCSQDGACENLSGSDLSTLMNEASVTAAFEDDPSSDVPKPAIKEIHFKRALRKVSPSVSDEQKAHYRLLYESFKAGGRWS